jgi:uncharacterized protein YkwD
LAVAGLLFLLVGSASFFWFRNQEPERPVASGQEKTAKPQAARETKLQPPSIPPTTKAEEQKPPELTEEPRAAPPPEPKSPDPVPPPAEKKTAPPVQDGIVFYPVDGQEGVPLEFSGNEVPDPLPDTADKLGGYPITVTFPAKRHVRAVKARLTDGDGREISVWLSSPERPANPAHADVQQNTVCLIAKSPLRYGTRYSVSVAAEVDGKPWRAEWAFTTVTEADLRQELVGRLLERLNGYRKVVGLPTLTQDAIKSRACAAHANYLAKNVTANSELNWREEKPELPGYSVAGNEIARGACIRRGGGPISAAEWLGTSCINRGLVLEPGLQTAGIGFAKHAQLGYVWVIDLVSGRRPVSTPVPILFPAPGQKGVPVAYSVNERPSPIPEEARGKDAGYAVTARFSFGITIRNATASLTDPEGKDVPAWLSTPEKPIIPGALTDVICLIPKTPLRPGTTYAVKMAASVRGEPWRREWRFTTRENPEDKQEEFAAHVLSMLNTSRALAGLPPVALDAELSRSCLLHARYVVRNAGQAAVQGLGVHNEDPKLPGYTPEGRKAGKAAVIASLDEPLDTIEAWVSTLYHRVPLFDPDLKKIGFGFAQLPDRNWVTVLDAGNGRADRPRK